MQGRADRSMLARNVVIALAIVVAVVALVLLWRSGGEGPAEPPADGADRSEAGGEPPERSTSSAERAAAEGPIDAVSRWTELIGARPEWPADLGRPDSCDTVRHDLARVCAALDASVEELREHGGACALVERILPELAASPPELSSELRSYETMLGNVFHLFRVVGREGITAARAALAREELAEPAALALYRWAVSHERCARGAQMPIRREALYAYSGFLFTTLGGQAYLRRRSPAVEGLACFYALQVLDESRRGGYDPAGVDPRPEIDRCRELVRNDTLVFAERYVASLEEMQERWRATESRRD